MVHLVSVEKLRSPLLPDFVRIAGEIRFEQADPQTVWFDVPDRFESYISDRGEPWLVLLLPCAVVAGEDLSLDLPVDPLLLYNLQGVQRVWQSWFDWAKPINIKAPTRTNPVTATQTALLFSGGVDAYFSLLGANPEIDRTPDAPLSSLLTISGLENRSFDPEAFARDCERGEQAAGQFNKQFIPIVTNLTVLEGHNAPYRSPMSHGAELASIGHLLSNRYQNILIAASDCYAALSPWGSHPLVDPQFSSAKTKIIHDGAASTRVEKTARVCAVPEAARALQVCGNLKYISNCGKCEKCLRTMVAIDLFDMQHLATTFDWSEYSLDRVAKMFIYRQGLELYAHETRAAALARGRDDIVRAIDRSLKLSKRLRLFVAIVSLLQKVPYFRRYEPSLRRDITKRRVLG